MTHESDISQTIRLYVDGELPEADARQFEAHVAENTELQRRIAFEKSLRTSVARSLGDDRTTADLASHIGRALALKEADDEVIIASAGDDDGKRQTRPIQTNFRVNYVAVAASIAVVVGAVLFGIYGPRMADRMVGPPPADPIMDVSTMVSEKHSAMLHDPLPRLRRQSVAEAEAFLSSVLNVHPTVADLTDSDYEFIGSDLCTLPGCPQGCMWVYQNDNPLNATLVCVHVVPMTPELGESLVASIQRSTLEFPLGCRFVDVPDDVGTSDVIVWATPNEVYFVTCTARKELWRASSSMQLAMQEAILGR